MALRGYGSIRPIWEMGSPTPVAYVDMGLTQWAPGPLAQRLYNLADELIEDLGQPRPATSSSVPSGSARVSRWDIFGGAGRHRGKK